MSGHLWSMETNSESQRVCRRCCDEAAGSKMNISTRWSMALRCCFGRLFASLSTWLACQRCAQRPRLTTPRLPPRPSRRNCCIGPEGATSLAGPFVTLTKLQWLELRYGPPGGMRGGGAWWTGGPGRAEGKYGWARCREGGNTPLRHVHPSALPPADHLFPQSPSPSRYDSLRPSPTQAQHPRPRQRVGPGGVARAVGRPAVPEPHRPWRRRSLGWADCRTWTSASQGVARRAGIILIILIIEIIVLFVIIYIIAVMVIIGVVSTGTRCSRSHLDGQTYCNR